MMAFQQTVQEWKSFLTSDDSVMQLTFAGLCSTDIESLHPYILEFRDGLETTIVCLSHERKVVCRMAGVNYQYCTMKLDDRALNSHN